jgi:hypothetical protein
MTATKVARVLAILSLPKPVPAFINFSKAVIQKTTNNPNFPTPEPPLATLQASTNDLETSEAAALARTKGAATTRNQKRVALVTLYEQFKGYVQKQADANPETAAALIESAGLSVKKATLPKKRVFAVTPGAVSGAVKLVAASAARRASYEWQYSSDGGKTWVAAPATLQAKTTVIGLQPGATISFRYRPVTKTGEGDWSQPIAVVIK